MAMDFKSAYKGFNEATPDGRLPKINEAEDPPQQNGKDGTYDVVVIESEAFRTEKKAMGLRVVVEVESCNNGRFKPGTRGSLVFHNLSGDGIEDWMLKLSHGNLKDFLAPALSSAYDTEIVPTQEDIDGESWIEYLAQCSVGELTGDPPSKALTGARVRCQVTTALSKGRRNGKPNKFARCSFVALPKAETKAA